LAPVGGVVARRTAGGARGPAVAGAVGWFLHEGERLLDVEVIGVLIGPGGTRGHSASARVSAVAAEDASGVALSGVASSEAALSGVASSAQRAARAAALRAASATASRSPPARAA